MKRLALVLFMILFGVPSWAQQPSSFITGLEWTHSRYTANWKDSQLETQFSANQATLSLTSVRPGFALMAAVSLPRVEWVGTSDLAAGPLVVGESIFKRKDGGQRVGQPNQQTEKPIDVSLLLKSQTTIEALASTRIPGMAIVGSMSFLDLTLTANGEIDGKQTHQASETIQQWFPSAGIAYRYHMAYIIGTAGPHYSKAAMGVVLLNRRDLKVEFDIGFTEYRPGPCKLRQRSTNLGIAWRF
jgi:hypothetical protein